MVNNRWTRLSQNEKAELLGIYTSMGYNDLASIIAHYNSCGGKLKADGGFIGYLPFVGNVKSSGGKIHIAPSKRGTFTVAAKKHGKSVQAFASQVLAHKENYSPAMVKKANFARNSARWKHEDGGPLANYLDSGGPYGVIPLGGDYLTYLQTMPEVSGGMIEPSVVTAALPSKFNGSQAAAARYAEGYQKGAKPVSEAMNRAGQDIFKTVDTVVGLTPTPAGAITWLGHMGADVANGEYGKVGRDLGMAAAMGLGLGALGKGYGYLRNYVDEATNFGEDIFRAMLENTPGRVSTNFTYALPATRAAMEAVPAATKAYEIADLGGGYMLKSLMRGNPLEKQLSKNGTVNVNNVRALANKGSKVERAVIDKVLSSEEFAGQKSIDYNKFRKAVQDELITYERTPNTNWNNYGIDRLGISSYMDAAESPEMIDRFNEFIMSNFSWGPVSDLYYIPGDPSSKSFDTNDLAKMFFEDGPGFSDVPVGVIKELDTFTFSSPRIPRGSDKHYNANTLGHSRTYTTADEPDVLHVMESQSDWAQGNPKIYDKQFLVDNTRAIIDDDISELNRLKSRFKEKYGIEAPDFDSRYSGFPKGWSPEQFDDYTTIDKLRYNLERNKEQLPLAMGEVSGELQKQYMVNNYTSRQIQENLRYAAEKGQTKMRYPTRETAAKIEGYQKSRSQTLQDNPELQKQYDELRDALKAEEDRIVKKYAPEYYLDESLREADFEDMGLSEEETERLLDQIRRSEQFERSAVGAKMREEIIEAREKMDPDKWLRENVEEKYIPQHETILKKYDAFPKQYQKLYKGADVRTVTDPKGNTWYEVDVPEGYLQQEWTYKNGGKLRQFADFSGLF